MPFTQQVMPQFRDADEDGLIGLRGFMRYFQDIHTWYMHRIDKGNDTLPEQYGAAWVYTRYRLHRTRNADYTAPLTLSAWMEPYRQPVLVTMDMTVSQHGGVIATGKLESCVFSLSRRRPLRLSAVDFPEGMAEDDQEPLPDFFGIERSAEGMEERYRRTVRYSDLDKNRHMNNLRYIEMFEDAFDSAFWERLRPADLELRFLSECAEGETLSVLAREEDRRVSLAALHADGSLAAVAMFAGE